MLRTQRALRGIVTAPHHLAAQAGLDVLREGGNAVEAMVAAAAAIAVVYPHMNALGGDGFWLVAPPGEPPTGIDACGPAAGLASIDWYRNRGCDAIPSRGPLAALTVAGTVSGWATALARFPGRLPLDRLLAEAIQHARGGIAVTASQAAHTAARLDGLRDVPGFARTFLADGRAPGEGSILRQPHLAATLEHLARAGLDDFYRGEIGASLARDLADAGSPLRRPDLEGFHARVVVPLRLRLRAGTVYNLPPPTQGLASLMILGIFDRLACEEADSFAHVHGLVEATKRAFRVRDRHVTDPDYMATPPARFLADATLDALAAEIDSARALPWPAASHPGDTVWMGAIDAGGLAVSFIQSIYWEYGAGLVLGESGVHWQNRGIGFSLDEGATQALRPGRRPFHTLNPALARLDDGRTLAYGTMGGEGQPQTQAAVFTRHVRFGQALQQAVTAPRWLLGRTWGDESTTLKLERRFDDALVEQLRRAGHDLELVAPFTDAMGHAGAVARRPDGVLEGAADPRGDGAVAAF